MQYRTVDIHRMRRHPVDRDTQPLARIDTKSDFSDPGGSTGQVDDLAVVNRCESSVGFFGTTIDGLSCGKDRGKDCCGDQG